MARYARRLTKQDLIDNGITEITKDGRVFKYGKEIELYLNTSGYKYLWIYDRDENGCCIKIPGDRPGYFTYKQRTISLNRAMIAWHYGVIEDGLVADHIDNDKNNYNLENLQAISPKENVNKGKDNWHIKETRCQMTKPRKFYEDKLEKFLAEYDEAKKNGEADKAHHLRGKISQTRSRLRYWDSHKEEYEEYITSKEIKNELRDNWKQNVKDRKLLEQYKQMFKESGNKRMWHQMCKVIKAWDKLESLQKEHIFEVLHRFFSE